MIFLYQKLLFRVVTILSLFLEPITSISSALSSINTSPIEVSKVLRQLKKSNFSHCGISGRFVNIIATPLSFSLSRMFNNCFEIGHFPDIFKISHVTALWKRSGLKLDPSMYRPIALLPTISRAAKAIIHDRLSAHLLKITSLLKGKLPM